MDKPKLKIPEGVTDEQLQVWKKKYGKLVIVNVEDEDKEVFSIVFKRPNKDIIAAFTRKAKQDEILAGDFLYKSCMLAEDPGMKNDDILKLVASVKLGELLEKYKGRRANY